MVETQKFYIDEKVAVVDANNRLRFGDIEISVDDEDDDRVRVRFTDSGSTAYVLRAQVAHL
jgi:hypothetical protein